MLTYKQVVNIADQNFDDTPSRRQTVRFTEVKDDRGSEKGDDRNPNNWKWCSICKIPSEVGTVDEMPEGAKWELCNNCNREHWINQFSHHHENVQTDDECHADDESEDKKKKSKGGEKKKNGDAKDTADNDTENKDSSVKEKNGDDKDNSKDGDEKKGDASKENGHGSYSWTSDQDKMILEMKSTNKSWKEIAAALNSSKGQVTHRFKELKKLQESGETTVTTPVDEVVAVHGVAAANGATTAVDDGQSAWGVGVHAGDNPMEVPYEFNMTAGLSAEDAALLNSLDDLIAATNPIKTKVRVTLREEDDNVATASGDNNGQDNWGTNGDDYQVQPDANFDSDTLAGPSDEDVPSGPPPGFYGNLVPDATWTKNDCDILEHLQHRYHDEKWLHMQANFYNYTGRMIAAEFIERKFRADGAAI